ncbi:hypothetical protein JM16_002260 [Phytophthora kernoviae]|uniref:Chromodomain-helicase-DNA-binding protein 7 n=1 Tax=Phytophthora kernoviae TaxID=325452 RepID=A0A8T0LXV9_9STRA|nr:hypothetical protein JM16_002260 [Phytophthora kernoviae]
MEEVEQQREEQPQSVEDKSQENAVEEPQPVEKQTEETATEGQEEDATERQEETEDAAEEQEQPTQEMESLTTADTGAAGEDFDTPNGKAAEAEDEQEITESVKEEATDSVKVETASTSVETETGTNVDANAEVVAETSVVDEIVETKDEKKEEADAPQQTEELKTDPQQIEKTKDLQQTEKTGDPQQSEKTEVLQQTETTEVLQQTEKTEDPQQTEMTEEQQQTEKTEVLQQTETTEVVQETEKTEVLQQTEKTEVVQQTEDPQQTEMTEEQQQTEKTEVLQQTETTEVVQETEKTEVLQQTEKTEVVQQTEDPQQTEMTENPQQPEKTEKTEDSQRIEKTEELQQTETSEDSQQTVETAPQPGQNENMTSDQSEEKVADGTDSGEMPPENTENQTQPPTSDADNQMQFPYAPSNFVAPAPTPIRPLQGDPRAVKQQPQEGSDSTNEANTTNTNEPAPTDVPSEVADPSSGAENANSNYTASDARVLFQQKPDYCRPTAELHVDGGGIRRLGVFATEKEAAMTYNQYIHQTYGNGAIQFMNPAGNMSGSGANGAPSELPVAMSNVRDMKPIQRPVRRPLLRAAFTMEQKEQLRAQIMVFKFTSTGGMIPNELLSRALKTTAHNYIQPGADRKKRKNFAAHVVTKPVKKAKRGRGKKKKLYSDEDEDESDSDDDYSGPKVLKEERPARRSGRNAGKAKKKYVEDEVDFELSEEEKPQKNQQKEAPKGPQMDKIVSVRFHKDTTPNKDIAMEFLIKWKDTSYLHVNWLTVREIEDFGQHAIMRMKRYLQKNSREVEDARESVVVGKEKDLSNYFSDSYIEVDRIINAKEVEEPVEVNPYQLHLLEKESSDTEEEENRVPKKKGVKYLVKWRDMSYMDCTWEWEDQLTDDRKIAAFHRFNHPPIINGAHPATYADIRPEPTTWAKYLESPTYNNQNTLRSYQLEGLNWLTFCWYNRRNCILADEMGLGKTVQATSILEHLRQREHIRGPFLVVAPLATLGNWKREIETWTSMNCVVYHDSEGGADIRAFLREQEFHFASEAHRRRGIYKFNVMVTSYQTLMMDAEHLENIHWRYIVIDEAHKLKNREAKLLQVLHGFTWDSCLLMTGTPLQNGVFELWCLLNFIEPDKFPSQQQFYDEFGDLSTAEQVAQLHEQLRPYMLRRVKEDVEKSIPPKEETIVDVELTTMQKKYYRAIFERNRSFLNMGATGTVANLVNVEMELRKCCNHPFLIRGVEDKECAGYDEQLRTKVLIQASGKTVLLDKLLTKFRQENKKILIFSQFKIMLDIIEDMCQLRGYSMERLDGSVRGNSRQAAIDRFNSPESDTFAFLLSTRAGGVGINLIAASVVILFDSDWNPQNDLQAVARCHRIGQTQSVNIYRLVTKKTYEAQMFEIASKKLGMHHAVFETGGVRNEFDGEDDSSGNMMSLMSLDREKVEMMIRYGAYAIMGEDDEQDPENRAINELDIDHLLSTSRTIRYDPTKTAENADGDEENSASGESDSKQTNAQSTALSFSKATFTAESSDTTIDFNDEKFWEKVLGPKPVQVLMTKVQEGWLKAASQDEVKDFLSQLRDLARAVVQERQRGGSLADADQVLAILIELKVTGPVIKGVVDGFLDDPIVQCEKCSVAVHQYCYGINAVPEGDTPWYCDYCAEPSGSPADATCELCPLKRPKSAFKKTSEGKWVHVVCALWAPGVQFSDVERMSGVKHVAAAIEEMKDTVCAVCDKKDGCIKCFRGACETYFHPMCGRESKGAYDMFMKEGGQLRAFCPKHRAHRKRTS